MQNATIILRNILQIYKNNKVKQFIKQVYGNVRLVIPLARLQRMTILIYRTIIAFATRFLNLRIPLLALVLQRVTLLIY